MSRRKEYAYYEGDRFITIGTYEELEKYTGLKQETLRFYATVAHRKRMAYDSPIVVSLDEEDEGEL